MDEGLADKVDQIPVYRACRGKQRRYQEGTVRPKQLLLNHYCYYYQRPSIYDVHTDWVRLRAMWTSTQKILSFSQAKKLAFFFRVRPKLGFGYGFGAETAKFLGFSLVSVTAVTRILVSAWFRLRP